MPPVSVRKVSVFLLVTLFVYYEIYRWTPLGAWNGEFRWPVHNDQFYTDIGIGVVLLWIIRSFYKRRVVSMWVSLVLLTAWLGLHVKLWWIPYLEPTGPQASALDQLYASRTQILPVIGSRHPPNAGRVVLDVLLFVAWLVSGLAAIRTRKKISWYIA